MTTNPNLPDHAWLSPSGSKRWFACAGSLTLEAPFPNKANKNSDEGTACHEVAAWCLTESRRAFKRVGDFIKVSGKREEPRHVLFTGEMAEMVQGEVERVRALIKTALVVRVEKRVDFSHIVGIPDQGGTPDVAAVVGDELGVHDFKFGHTPVGAEENTQLLIYALALYYELELQYEIKSIRLYIHQPRYRASEWACSVEWLLTEFEPRLKAKAAAAQLAKAEWGVAPDTVWERRFLNPRPNENECGWCRAMATCPAYSKTVQEIIGADFDVIPDTPPDDLAIMNPAVSLTSKMRAVPTVEAWCKAVRSEMERHLMAGQTDPEYGLELGRKGHRKWNDPQEVERTLRRVWRLSIEDAYDLSLKSPTALEKLTKPLVVVDPETREETTKPPPIGKNRWSKIQGFITQSDPVPSVKLLKDIKKPWSPTPLAADDFTPVGDADDLV